MDGQAGRAEGDVRQPPPHPGRSGQAVAARARREAGADVRAPARDRRIAPRPKFAGRRVPKTHAGSCRYLQPRAGDVQALRLRHPAWPAGLRSRGRGRVRTRLCGRSWPIRAHARPSCPKPRLPTPLGPPLAPQHGVYAPFAICTIGSLAGHFFHALLSYIIRGMRSRDRSTRWHSQRDCSTLRDYATNRRTRHRPCL